MAGNFSWILTTRSGHCSLWYHGNYLQNTPNLSPMNLSKLLICHIFTKILPKNGSLFYVRMQQLTIFLELFTIYCKIVAIDCKQNLKASWIDTTYLYFIKICYSYHFYNIFSIFEELFGNNWSWFEFFINFYTTVLDTFT